MDEEPRDQGFGRRLERDIHDRINERFDRFTDRRERRANRVRHRSPASGVIAGGLIVAVGLLLLLDNMGVIRARDFWRYWPVFIVFFGLAKIAERSRPASTLVGGCVALFGVLLLLDNLNFIILDFNLVWPLLIVIFGVAMLWNALGRRGFSGGMVTTNPDATLIAIFGGAKRRFESQDFQGCQALAIFGGTEIDLRGAHIATGQRALVDVTAIFGGVEIFVPENCRINVNLVPIFGGLEDKTRSASGGPDSSLPELVVSGTVIFGGVTLR